MNAVEIQEKIDKLEDSLQNTRGRICEIFTRIVGYYRPVDNWNKGKTEEYCKRTEFKIN
jgi:ribonucleoside-triphosphate reductase